MGYSITYTLVRDQPLTDAERVRLARHAIGWQKKEWPGESYRLDITTDRRADGLLAWGFVKPETYDGWDTQQLFDALKELRAVVDDAALWVDDDVQSVGWSEASGSYELDPALHVEGPDVDLAGEFVAPGELISPVGLDEVLPPALVQAVTAVINNDKPDTALLNRAPSIRKLLGAIPELENNEAAQRAVEAALDAANSTTVAVLGISASTTHRSSDRYVSKVLERIDRADDLVEPFLKRWRKQPKSKYHWADLLSLFSKELLGKLAATDNVQTELFSILDELLGEREFEHDERPYRRLEQSIKLLGHSKTEAAARRLVGLARRDRHRFQDERVRSRHHSYFHHVKIPVIDALGAMAFPRTFATFVLDLDAQRGMYFGHEGIVKGLCRVDFQRAIPLLTNLVELGIWVDVIAGSLSDVEGDGAAELLVQLTRYPLDHVRRTATRALAKRGHSFSDPPPLGPWYERVTHLDGMVRRAAFEEVEETRNLSDVLAMVAAEALDHELNRPLGGTSTVMWSNRLAEMPKEAHHLRVRHAWAREFAAGRDDQVVPGLLARVVEEGAAAVASTYPESRFRLSDEMRAALAVEEQEVWGEPA